jgi:type II secretory pathway component GspD/PulD (secretin)
LGILFSGNSDNNGKQELVIFVKATVVESKSDYEQVINRYNEALKFKSKSPELD